MNACYVFNEGSDGYAKDLSCNSQDINHGGDLTWDPAVVPWGSGLLGSGLDFQNDLDTYNLITINSPDPGFWHDGFTEFTTAMSVTLTADSGGPLALLDIGGGTGYFIGYRNTPDTIIFAVGNGSPNEIASVSTFAVGTTRLDIVARYNAGAMALFINGVKEATTTGVPSSINDHADAPCIGCASSGSSAENAAGLGVLKRHAARGQPIHVRRLGADG